LFQLRQELDAALVKIDRMDSDAQNKHMATNGLTYREICSKTEEEWKKLFDDGKWAPARIKPDSRRPPVGYGANVAELVEPEPAEPLQLQAIINALLQTLQSSKQDSGSKPGNCHLCNKSGLWARECPNKNQSC
jgi:hypothetical protein